jgi:hypothetical protein
MNLPLKADAAGNPRVWTFRIIVPDQLSHTAPAKGQVGEYALKQRMR